MKTVTNKICIVLAAACALFTANVDGSKRKFDKDDKQEEQDQKPTKRHKAESSEQNLVQDNTGSSSSSSMINVRSEKKDVKSDEKKDAQTQVLNIKSVLQLIIVTTTDLFAQDAKTTHTILRNLRSVSRKFRNAVDYFINPVIANTIFDPSSNKLLVGQVLAQALYKQIQARTPGGISGSLEEQKYSMTVLNNAFIKSVDDQLFLYVFDFLMEDGVDITARDYFTKNITTYSSSLEKCTMPTRTIGSTMLHLLHDAKFLGKDEKTWDPRNCAAVKIIFARNAPLFLAFKDLAAGIKINSLDAVNTALTELKKLGCKNIHCFLDNTGKSVYSRSKLPSISGAWRNVNPLVHASKESNKIIIQTLLNFQNNHPSLYLTNCLYFANERRDTEAPSVITLLTDAQLHSLKKDAKSRSSHEIALDMKTAISQEKYTLLTQLLSEPNVDLAYDLKFANPNLLNDIKQTPLACAVFHQNLDAVKELIRKGANDFENALKLARRKKGIGDIVPEHDIIRTLKKQLKEPESNVEVYPAPTSKLAVDPKNQCYLILCQHMVNVIRNGRFGPPLAHGQVRPLFPWGGTRRDKKFAG